MTSVNGTRHVRRPARIGVRAARAGSVLLGTVAALFVLGVGARADVVEPNAPFGAYQPQPKTSLPASATRNAEATQPAAPPTASDPSSEPATEPVPVEHEVAPAPEEGVEPLAAKTTAPTMPAANATPAPEQVVTAAVRPVPVVERHESASTGSALDRVMASVRSGFNDAGSFLGEVASACKVGVGQGVGAPVLLFAVLGMVTALARHRVFGTWGPRDEDPPELLYAWGVIAPG